MSSRATPFHKARPKPDDEYHCIACHARIKRVPGGQGPTYIHADTGAVVAPGPDPEVTQTMTLHMAETRHVLAYDEWVAFCRCGWTGSYLPTQSAARTEGDKHLKEENGVG